MATIGSGLKSTSINGVKMYMVSSQQRSPASWVGSRKKRPSLKDKNCMKLRMRGMLRHSGATYHLQRRTLFLSERKQQPLEITRKPLPEINIKFGPGGSRKISFTSRSSAAYKEDGGTKKHGCHKRRGIQLLGLRSAGSGFRGNRRGGSSRGRGRRGGRH